MKKIEILFVLMLNVAFCIAQTTEYFSKSENGKSIVYSISINNGKATVKVKEIMNEATEAYIYLPLDIEQKINDDKNVDLSLPPDKKYFLIPFNLQDQTASIIFGQICGVCYCSITSTGSGNCRWVRVSVSVIACKGSSCEGNCTAGFFPCAWSVGEGVEMIRGAVIIEANEVVFQN